MSERRRNAPTAAPQSDVIRLRGLLVAAIAAGVAVLVAVLAGRRDAPLGSPGPLARPHVRAGLVCASCHKAEPKAACAGCHGPHPSTRPGHRALAAAGRLGCPTCHPAHRGFAGVTFGAGGALQFGPGGERAVDAGDYHPTAPLTVPIVAAASCAGCHDPGAADDPIAACLLPGQAGLGAARPTVCFDEHRGALAAGPRDAAWDAAREVAAAHPRAPWLAPPRGRFFGWLGVGALAGLVAWSAPRLRRRARGRPAAAPPAAPSLRRLPVINASTCIGCHACVDACPYDVLEVRDFVAAVARPNDCCGLTLCAQHCPNGSLVMSAGEPAPTGPAVSASLESAAVPGLYLAGDLTGVPLIRNAINQGALAVRAAAAGLERHRGGDLDLLVVGAGPAGLSAALEAKALGLRYVVLEQATVAASIQSFPRGKLVFDQPLELPRAGRLWLAEATKEELLGVWLRVVRSEELAIEEGWRVVDVARDGAAAPFTITAVDADGGRRAWRARRVVVAIGRRGSPRQLAVEVPPALASRVHYALADARSFAGRKVLVVGLGDVAMETAVALSYQPGTEVVVSYRGDGFHRGKQRNVTELQRRVRAGQIRLHLGSEVVALSAAGAALRTPDGRVDVACDALFVMIGSLPDADLLARAGLAPPAPPDPTPGPNVSSPALPAQEDSA